MLISLFLLQKQWSRSIFLLEKIASHFPPYATTAGTQLRDYACPFQQLHLRAVLGVGHLPLTLPKRLRWLLPHSLSLCCCRCFSLDTLEAAAIPGVRAAPVELGEDVCSQKGGKHWASDPSRASWALHLHDALGDGERKCKQ